MKYPLILFLLFMLSCGSMKKTKSLSIDEGIVKNEATQTEESTTNMRSFQNSSFKIENNGYNISVKPLNGQNSFFNFTSPDGQIFHGNTNAEINFEKKAKKQESVFSRKSVTVTNYFSHMTYKSHTTYKSVTKFVDKYKEAYPWYYILIAGFMLREMTGWIWRWLKNSQWYLQLIENLNKKR